MFSSMGESSLREANTSSNIRSYPYPEFSTDCFTVSFTICQSHFTTDIRV